MKLHPLTPKLVTVLKGGYSASQFSKDAISGIIVGIVALPLAIAFAIASGVSPEKGLVTAIIAGIIISALGGSRVQIGGPTGAFIVIVYAIVQKHGVSGLTIATLMGGILIIVMGLARLGNLLRFISYPLIVGFTSGIAIIIFSSQIPDLLGMSIAQAPADFVGKWTAYALHFTEVNPYSLLIGLSTVVIALFFYKITPKVPGSLVAIVLSTLAVHYLHLPVDTIESRFGDIPNHFSMPSLPRVDFATVQDLIQPAIAIALLGSIESLLSAVVADGMTGGRHRPNAELLAQGTANVFSALFGGIPATGAIARTATNIKNGGRTPVAGIIHALVLLLIMLLFAPLAKLIPMACLAGILVVVAYHMSEWRPFVSLLKGNKMDVTVLVATFALTVVFDLVIAIEVGMILSGFVLMKRVSDTTEVQKTMHFYGDQDGNGEKLFEEEIPALPQGVIMYEIHGALFFGATQKFQDTLQDLNEKPRVLILRMRHVPFIDATGIYRLKAIIKYFERQKVHTILSGVNATVREELENGGIYESLDRQNLLESIGASVERARELVVR